MVLRVQGVESNFVEVNGMVLILGHLATFVLC